MAVLDPADRTDISSIDKITFVNSPLHLRIQNATQDNTIQRVVIYLWVWSGAQNKVLGNANFTLLADKVSASDTYINFQVADIIKAFIKPSFAYNELDDPAIAGQGVFWQYKAVVTTFIPEHVDNILLEVVLDTTIIENFTSDTYFATLGYRWNYEQNNTVGNNGLSNYGANGFVVPVDRWYNDLIHNYITQSFSLATTVADATTENVIIKTPVTIPSGLTRCTKDPSLIVFINKLGLFEMFTPHGKITVNDKVKRETTNRVFRDPSRVDNRYQHSKQITGLNSNQSYTINTGSLFENMTSIIEEIIYSSITYLILFKGDIHLTSTIGITIDSEYVTIDDTITTIDSQTSTEEMLGMYKTHQQIPVVCMDEDFIRKTRLNDKNTIDYTLKFDETNNKLLDIR